MPIRTLLVCLAGGALFGLLSMPASSPAVAQDRLPWVEKGQLPPPAENAEQSRDQYGRAPADDVYSPRGRSTTTQGYGNVPANDDAYRPPRNDNYRPPDAGPRYGEDRYASQGYAQPYSAPGRYGEPYERGYGRGPPPQGYAYNDDRSHHRYDDGTYSMREILDAGHGLFGSVSRGLASVVEYAFQRQGRPNGYILGEELGGAFVAGLRYGEGWLNTRDAGRHKVFWQGPSIGYDAGAEGSKVMVLVYNLRDPYDIYRRFGGVDGSAYVVGGVGLTFLAHGDIVLAPIRSGVGLRLGANVGYLKYTRRPTWNPF
jgi:hypothetical protein